MRALGASVMNASVSQSNDRHSNVAHCPAGSREVPALRAVRRVCEDRWPVPRRIFFPHCTRAPMSDSSEPRVTLVMTARERYSLTEGVIDGIVADTTAPYRFMYLDCASPRWLRDILDARAAEWNLDVVRFDEPLWPQQARDRIIGRIATEYVVFLDNDLTVEPGWLEAIIACADETRAGIVAPLYLLGDGVRPAMVHMAGGTLVRQHLPEGVVLEESHRLQDTDPRQVRLERGPCDFGEFHCMLVRSSLLHDGALDPEILC